MPNTATIGGLVGEINYNYWAGLQPRSDACVPVGFTSLRDYSDTNVALMRLANANDASLMVGAGSH